MIQKTLFEKIVNLLHKDLVLFSSLPWLLLKSYLELVHVDSSSNILVSHFLKSTLHFCSVLAITSLCHTMSFFITPISKLNLQYRAFLLPCSESSCIPITTLLLHMLYEVTETSNPFILSLSPCLSNLLFLCRFHCCSSEIFFCITFLCGFLPLLCNDQSSEDRFNH